MNISIFRTKHLVYTISAFCLSLLLFTSCSDDDDDNDGGMTDPDPTENIVEIAQGDDRFDILVEAVVAAGLDDDLSGTGPFTLFAPTDNAFEDLLANTEGINAIEDISSESLIQILQYHVANGELLSSDLSDGQSVPTLLSGESVVISIDGNTVSINDASVIDPDIMGTNGVIHAIDQILVPEGFVIEPATQSIATLATETESLSTLVNALQRVPNLLEAAGDETANLTVFAPTNDAFAALLETLATATGNTYESLDDVPDYVLERVLQYHILATAKTASELSAEEETLEGSSLSIDGTSIDGTANVIDGMADIEASNGIVHVIDAVLVPSFILNSLGTVLEPAVFDAEGRFTTLLTAIETAELSSALTNADATLTVFAPTNDAFSTYIEENDFADASALLASEMLDEILLYHVLGSEVPSTAIASGASSAQTLNNEGEEIYISNNGENGIFLNGFAEVIIADLDEANGITHVINGVLTPPTNTIAETVVASAGDTENPQFTLLLAALQNADDTDGGLVDLLGSEEGTYTVFAPTDQAFIDAGFVDVAAIEDADPATLRAVLLYHVIPSAVFSTDLSSGTVTTAGGSDITVNVADPVTISDLNEGSSDAEVVDVNMLATNGVIHVINQVLLPE